MRKKGFLANPIFMLIAFVVILIAFVFLTSTDSYLEFSEKFLPLVLTLVIGVLIGVVSNAFGIFGNKFFNIVMLTFYGLIRWLFDSWAIADNNYVSWIFSPIATTFVVGYAIGTFFGKMI